MAEATGFTRAAGLAGLLMVPLFVLAFVVSRVATRHDPFGGPGLLGGLLVIAALLVTLTLYAGLLARHSGQWWVWPVVGLTVLAFFVAFRPGNAGAGVSAAAAILLGTGIANAGALPRHAGIAVAVGAAVELVFDATPLEVVGGLVSLYGFLVLAWAMWREGAHPAPGTWEGNVIVKPSPFARRTGTP